MGNIQLFQDEELFLRFRPHILSFTPHYVGSLGWMVAATIGAATGILLPETLAHPSIWGLFAMVTVGLIGGGVRRKIRGGSMAYSWFAVLAALGAIVAILVADLPDEQPWLPSLALGVLLTGIRLVGWELMRLQRVHFLTSQRLVVRAGLGHRQEESLPLSRIVSVRAQLGPMGQLFDYGDLILSLGTVGRGKSQREDTWPLPGIGRLTDVKHQLEQLLEEARLPLKDRRRRVEERRLRESMRRLAAWMRKDRTQLGLSL